MVAARSVTGLTGNSGFDKSLFHGIHTGCVAAGALYPPFSLLRLVSLIGGPLVARKMIGCRQDNQIITNFFQVLLPPLAAQGVSDLFFAKGAHIIGCFKITDVCQRVGFDVPHHARMQGSLPFQVGSLVAFFAGFRTGESCAEAVFEFARELQRPFVDQVLAQHSRCRQHNYQGYKENKSDGHWNDFLH